jgi:hypothetical protein
MEIKNKFQRAEGKLAYNSDPPPDIVATKNRTN